MDKIYNLQKTIYNDKMAIKEIERELAFRKSILSAHEKALERALSPKEYSPVLEKKSPQSITEKQQTPKERITLENWKSLGIEVGDQVEIVVSGDGNFMDDCLCGVVDVEDLTYNHHLFLKLSSLLGNSWGWYESTNYDEIYLIRTPSGSGN